MGCTLPWYRKKSCLNLGTGLSIESVCYTWRLELVSYKQQKRNGGGMLHSLIRPLSQSLACSSSSDCICKASVFPPPKYHYIHSNRQNSPRIFWVAKLHDLNSNIELIGTFPMYCNLNILTTVIRENNRKVCYYRSYKFIIPIYSLKSLQLSTHNKTSHTFWW